MKIKLSIIIILLISTCLKAQIEDKSVDTKSLLSTAKISVTLGGDFPLDGSYPAFISERVDQFVSRIYIEAKQRSIGLASDTKLLKEVEKELTSYSLRGILLKRASGEEIEIDLQKFRITGDFQYNPYLKNDDVLIFPAYDIERNFFTVSGAVNKPGTFYFVEGDDLQDALELSLGISEAYENNGRVSISRLSYDGNSLSVDTVDIRSNFKLERGDQIKVLGPETRRLNNLVTILGEVKNPGSYPITINNTKLIDVINSAGGFTENASLRRAKLYSKNSLSAFLENEYNITLTDQPMLENNSIRNLIVHLESNLMYRMSTVYPEDASYFFLEEQLRVLIESSSIDLTKINDSNSALSNHTVQKGDIIIIPTINNSIYVFGQIVEPGYIPIVKGMQYDYYIQKAGGLGELAVEEDIMVIKGGSRAWVSPIEESVVLEEGDYIYVPKERLRSTRDYAAEYSIYIQMLSSIATVVLLIIAAFK
jgi:protein involved in polysaccharide export with SLBB domain